MQDEEYDNLIAMLESKIHQDFVMAEDIFCNMNADEISKFLTYWGQKKGTYRNSLPPRAFDHFIATRLMNEK